MIQSKLIKRYEFFVDEPFIDVGDVAAAFKVNTDGAERVVIADVLNRWYIMNSTEARISFTYVDELNLHMIHQ